MPLFSNLMSPLRSRRPVQGPSTKTLSEERLVALSRELREEVVNALVAEGERVWDSLSTHLVEYVAEVEATARSDVAELERRVREEVAQELSGPLIQRVDEKLERAFERLRVEGETNARVTEELKRRLETIAEAMAEAEHRLKAEIAREGAVDEPRLEALAAEAARTEFEPVTERIARMLIAHRRQTDAYLDEEFERMREELQPKVVVRRTERPPAPAPSAPERLDQP